MALCENLGILNLSEDIAETDYARGLKLGHSIGDDE